MAWCRPLPSLTNDFLTNPAHPSKFYICSLFSFKSTSCKFITWVNTVFEFEWRFYLWMKLEGNLPLGHDALLFSITGTGCIICTVAQTLLDIPRPLITQSHRHCWTYQGLWLPSHTDTAGHTKAFDHPVAQTLLDIPRPLITQSHRHCWTYQGLWLPSHTDTAGHTKAFDYPVTQTLLDIPRPLITQSHRHGWTYQGLWLPSHTDTAGHTKAFDYPVTDLFLFRLIAPNESLNMAETLRSETECYTLHIHFHSKYLFSLFPEEKNSIFTH